ncbi:MAG: hypothetical protein IJS97_09450 [Prevotella sp.]|nr:hypothetical protein [Prevotella sp.]
MMMQFADKMVSYDTFLNDVASRIVEMINRNDPETLSQREAYRRFGRGNVDRWRRKGLLKTCKRPGKVEYNTAELRRLQSRQQDYFT